MFHGSRAARRASRPPTHHGRGSMQLKRMTKSIIHRFGFEVYRIAPQKTDDPDATVPVHIGPYQILMYANGTLHRTLAAEPDYSGQLRRLVALAAREYPDLAMIDVGANFGDTAAIAKLGADIPIFCIEGDPRAFRLLEQNIRQLPGVTARCALLGERVEDIPALFQKQGWNLTVIPQDAAASGPTTTTASLTTLDECMRGLADPDRYRVLKIDAEGFDCRIIRGGMQHIERVKPIIMMEYNRENMDQIGEPGFDTLMRLRVAGYRDIVYFDQSGRLILATTLDEEDLMRDLHDYANGRDGSIYYVDLCLFHARDGDLAREFTRTERARRIGD